METANKLLNDPLKMVFTRREVAEILECYLYVPVGNKPLSQAKQKMNRYVRTIQRRFHETEANRVAGIRDQRPVQPDRQACLTCGGLEMIEVVGGFEPCPECIENNHVAVAATNDEDDGGEWPVQSDRF